MTPRLCAIAVALAATVLTPQASAQQDAPAGSRPDLRADLRHDAPPAASEGPTPLALRPNKALELAKEPEHASAGWKVVAGLAVLGGAAFYLRKKRWKPRPGEDGQLTIVRRAAIGMRSELLIVNVEGQRMLLGVTPQSIQTLAMLDPVEGAAMTGSEARSALLPSATDAAYEVDRGVIGAANAQAAASSRGGASDGPGRGQDLGGRFAAMLRAADPEAPAPRTTSGEGAEEPHVAGQARGLLALRRRR